MSSYQDGKIYKIVSLQTDSVYIGSTTQTLSLRMTQHKNDYRYWLNNQIGRAHV